MSFRTRGFLNIFLCLLIVESSHLEDSNREPNPKDYCHYESFNPQCTKNEIILMRKAIYGRMRIGRCVTNEEVESLGPLLGDDPRKIGCSENVLELLHRKCSARNECEVRASDFTVANIKPCFPILNLYLEASYDCITVVDEERSCIVSALKKPNHVTSKPANQRICGTKVQPLTIEAPIGEKVSIKLIDFTPTEKVKGCRNYGVIVDKAGKRNTSICGDGLQKETKLYVSTRNVLDIIFTHQDQGDSEKDNAHFILKFEAVGCSDLIPPKDAWLKRNNEVIVIGCYAARQTWHLHCVEGNWIGVMGNCTQAIFEHDSPSQPDITTKLHENNEVLVLIVIGVATLTLCLIVFCTGGLCLRRFYFKNKKKETYKTLDQRCISTETKTKDQRTFLPIQVNENNISGVYGAQDVPTYSVYVGESGD